MINNLIFFLINRIENIINQFISVYIIKSKLQKELIQ